jgi:hypothetical protein
LEAGLVGYHQAIRQPWWLAYIQQNGKGKMMAIG